jgi:hypothetical protein
MQQEIKNTAAEQRRLLVLLWGLYSGFNTHATLHKILERPKVSHGKACRGY